MKLPFILAMGRRESRAGRRRLGLYAGSIGLGVAALVSINSFRANVTDAIHAESRDLLGADLELRSTRMFPTPIQGLIDSTVSDEIIVSYVTSFAAMALAADSQRAHLVDVRAVEGTYPFYGTIETEPPSRWAHLQNAHNALVDPAVLVQLDAAVGDTIAIGNARFAIDGLLSKVPGDVAFLTALGGRVYIAAAHLDETGLLGFGSRTVYRAFFKFAEQRSLDSFLATYEDLLRTERVRYETATEREQDFTNVLDLMARFLGMVGLIALLLGGVGVASAVHVFVRGKLQTVAILRCLGASQQMVFAIYLLQAVMLGVLGAASGVALGLVVQASLPDLLHDFLPVEIHVSVEWPAIFAGLLIGVWVAVMFAMLPLLTVRNIAPLQALRREFESARSPGVLRFSAHAAVVLTMVALSLWQAPDLALGAAFAVALGSTTLLLWLAAWSLIRMTRRLLPRKARYVYRQGIANLYRPHNQTVAITLAVGFGVFLITTVYVVQGSLLHQISLDATPDRPNLVLFDVQKDQRDSVESLIIAHGLPILSTIPIVPARISHINGRNVREILSDTSGPRVPGWALRREYSNTYRDSLVESERLVEGAWWNSGDERQESEREDRQLGRPTSRAGVAADVYRISVEQQLARDLRVIIGDRITWDIQGVQIESEVANLRQVDWARLNLNFFVVFELGALNDAPQTFVTVTRSESAIHRAELQRDLVLAFPNVAGIDLAVVQESIDSILSTVSFAVRFMALFSIVSGLIVLGGAVATSRFQRIKESVLIKTLGGRGWQIRQILLTEYAVLGLLAGLTGILLGSAAGGAFVAFALELSFHPPTLPLVAIWLGTAALTAAIGLASSGAVFRKPPLMVLREMGE
jgi:putative ABC transport system permease protein